MKAPTVLLGLSLACAVAAAPLSSSPMTTPVRAHFANSDIADPSYFTSSESGPSTTEIMDFLRITSVIEYFRNPLNLSPKVFTFGISSHRYRLAFEDGRLTIAPEEVADTTTHVSEQEEQKEEEQSLDSEDGQEDECMMDFDDDDSDSQEEELLTSDGTPTTTASRLYPGARLVAQDFLPLLIIGFTVSMLLAVVMFDFRRAAQSDTSTDAEGRAEKKHQCRVIRRIRQLFVREGTIRLDQDSERALATTEVLYDVKN